MAKDEIKVGDEVFAEQGFEDADGQHHDVTAVVESISEEGVVKLKSEEFDLSGYDYELGDLVKKSKKETPAAPSRRASGSNVVAPKGKMVEVDSSVLEKLLTSQEEMKKKIEDLEGAADVGRLGRIQAARNSGKLVKNAKVNFWDGKPVLAWVAEKDDVWFDEQGRLHEDQQITVVMYEGEGKTPSKSKPVSYRTFSRLVTKKDGEVIKESKDNDGAVSFTVLLADGLQIELPIVFLN